jgi:hypothetical protein
MAARLCIEAPATPYFQLVSHIKKGTASGVPFCVISDLQKQTGKSDYNE